MIIYFNYLIKQLNIESSIQIFIVNHWIVINNQSIQT